MWLQHYITPFGPACVPPQTLILPGLLRGKAGHIYKVIVLPAQSFYFCAQLS